MKDRTINRTSEKDLPMANKVLKLKLRRKIEVKNLLQAINGIKADDDPSVPFLTREDLYRDRPTNFVLQ